jgi:hypothetical protein
MHSVGAEFISSGPTKVYFLKIPNGHSAFQYALQCAGRYGVQVSKVVWDGWYRCHPSIGTALEQYLTCTLNTSQLSLNDRQDWMISHACRDKLAQRV